MTHHYRRHLLALALLAPAAAPAQTPAPVAGAPAHIDYQGRLLNSAGNPLDGGAANNYEVHFRVWDAQVGGNLVWAENQIVTVLNGNFSVRLGEGEAIAAANGDALPLAGSVPHSPTALRSVFIGTERYLGITVIDPPNPVGEIQPRLAFLSSPFSLVAERAKTADRVNAPDNSSSTFYNLNVGNRIGVNTTNPQRPLQVGEATVESEGIIRVEAAQSGIGFREWEVGVPRGGDVNGKNFSFIIDDVNQGTAPEFIVKYGSGNVGIGTVNPISKLHVHGRAYSRGAFFGSDSGGLPPEYGAGIRVFSDGGTKGQIFAFDYAGGGAAQDLILQSPGGNVGVGVLAPTQKLHVAGNILATGNVSAAGFTTSGPLTAASFIATGPVVGSTVSATSAMSAPFVGSTGAVSAGTYFDATGGAPAAPAKTVDGGTGTRLRLFPGEAGTRAPFGIGLEPGAQWYSADNHNFYSHGDRATWVAGINGLGLTVGNAGIPGNHGMIYLGTKGVGAAGPARSWSVGVPNGGANVTGGFYSFVVDDRDRAGTELMVEWGTGRVGIGTNAPAETLTVNGGAYIHPAGVNANEGLWVQRSDNNEVLLHANNNPSGYLGTSTKRWRFVYALSMHSASFNTTSDRRTKTDIRGYGEALEKIQRLEGVRFRYDPKTHPAVKDIADPEEKRELAAKEHLGFVAQDLRKVIPEMVGENDETGFLEIRNYHQLLPVVVEAMKELRAEKDAQIEERDQQIAAMEARLERLESMVTRLAGVNVSPPAGADGAVLVNAGEQ